MKNIVKITIVLSVLLGFAACNDSDDRYADSSISVATTELNYLSNGGERMFDINASHSIGWGVSSEADWLTVSTTSGYGDETIMVTASANPTNTTRTAIVKVSTHERTFDVLATQQASVDYIEPDSSEMSSLTSVQLTTEMGVGWNVGNSLDAVGGETVWGNPLISQQLIDAVKAAGFNTVRIPIAWSNYVEEGDDAY